MLEATAVDARYGRIRALRDVSLRVAPGEAVAVLGPNGAGKTTLMRVLAGSLPVAAGRVALDGADVTSSAADSRARAGIALCPEGRRIFTTLTVERNLLLGASPLRARLGRRAARAPIAARLEHSFELFPVLKERRHALGGALSGGQQQMLAIARALMSEPRLLLLDEPSLGLAPIVVDDLYRRLAALRDSGQTLVVVEESPERGLRVADRAYVLQLGTVAVEGTAQDVRSHPALRAAYLGEHGEMPA
jgi:branched-chain amino acid transport system ATP-binding protein